MVMASRDASTPSAGGGLFDIGRLSKFLSVPEETIAYFAELPEGSVEDVLRSITAKTSQYFELESEKVRLEVELEQAVRASARKAESIKAQLESALSETQELRNKANSAENARIARETELASYKASRTDFDEETRVLRVRVQSLESFKRDTLEALDRKSTDYDRLQDEYSALQNTSIESRRTISSLETKLQQAQSAQTTSKFREQNLAQEVELLGKHKDWLEDELQTKAAEFQKFRKEKDTQVSTLQRQLDDALSTVDMTQRNCDNINQRFKEVSKKADDALAKIKDLQDKAASQEESFKSEMNSQQRLAELFEQSTKSAKARVIELEQILEQAHERESVEIGHARAEMETERAEKQAAETKIAELEVQVERLEADLSTYASGGFIAGTPLRGSPNGASTPTRFSPVAARLQKSGMSITQLYSDYSAVKASFEAERRRNVKLEEVVQELVQDLEQKAPEIQDLRDLHDKMQQELVEMSQSAQAATKERDRALKETRKMGGKIGDYEREAAILRQQLRDLSNQIQILLTELHQRDSGADRLSPSQNLTFEKIISGQIVEESETDTDKLISQRLTVFRNVQELQHQNQELLKAIRELGGRMEREEEDRKKVQEGQEGEEVVMLKGVIERLKDELKTVNAKAQSFVRERDMFRRILQNKGQLSGDEEFPAPPASDAGSVTVADLNQGVGEVLRELQSQYDHFKNEALQNYNTLNEQTRRLAADKSELEMQCARIKSQLELATERYEMLNGNFGMMKSENQELQKRLNNMHENQARQDLTTQQVAEELVDSKSLIEGMRTENSNLKAEKKLWKSIEQRLSQDNEFLTQERGRLNGLIADLQSIQSERERSDSDSRRRLVSQVEKIESELSQTKRRLNEETEEAKKILIRKDAELRKFQEKIDELNDKFAATREAMVAAETSRDHLRSRVDELTIELKMTEEKLSVYQKPSAPTATEEDEDGLDREQELQIQLAELTKTLEFTKSDLEVVKDQVEHYKALAESFEEGINSMNASHDEYKESMEQQAAEHETKIRDLEVQLNNATAELASVNQRLSQLQEEEAENRRHFEEEKAILQGQITSLKEDAEKYTIAATFYQQDLRGQARIAQEAQQNYERELVKHAGAAQALQQIRGEYASLKLEVHELKSEADAAKTTLSNSESSWETQKNNYENEIRDVKTRYDDLVRQNKILLGQLDGVGEQISMLQKARAETDESGMGSPNNIADNSTDELREVIKYLRREKEIVDVQYELSLQEGRRIKQQLDHARFQLDETRLLLASERQKEMDQLKGVAQHKELMEKISELNLLRESNSALRSDGERKGKKLNELQARVEELEGKVQPLEEQVRTLEAEKEVLEEQVKLLQDDNERWKARTQQVMQKYDRVDPVELEELRSKVESADAKYAELVAERDSLQTQIGELQTLKQKEAGEIANTWRQRLNKLQVDAKEKLTNLRNKLNVEIASTAALTSDAVALRAQLETANNEQDGLMVEMTNLSNEKTRLTLELGELQNRVDEAEKETQSHRVKAQGFYKELATLKKQNEGLMDGTAAAATTTTTTQTSVDNEAAIQAEVARRLEETQPKFDEAAVEAEVSKRVEQRLVDAKPAQDEAAFEAEVNRRLETRLANTQPANDPAFIESEILRRPAEAQPLTPAATQPVYDEGIFEAEVNRRVEARLAEIQPVDNSAAIEAEVLRRLAEVPPPSYDESAFEAEVSRRVAEIQSSQAKSAQYSPSQDIESIVEERLKEEKAKLAEQHVRTEARIKDAQSKFQGYKAAAVKKATDDQAAEFKKTTDEIEAKHKKTTEEMEAKYKTEIQKLESEIRDLKEKIEDMKRRLADLEAQATGFVGKETELVELQKALKAKDAEKQEALKAKDKEQEEALANFKRGEDERLEDMKLQHRYDLEAEFLANKTLANPPSVEPTNKPGPTQEELKAIIKKNVEHRLGREKEKWEKEAQASREKEFEEKLSTALKEKLSEKQVELQAAQQALLEKSKDALRQEGAARIKVQVSMLEKKNKTMEEKLKVLEAGRAPLTPTQQNHSPVSQPPAPPQQSGIRPPQVSMPPQHAQQMLQQGHDNNRRENHGTGPAALRSLRGALGSNIPRGGRGGSLPVGRGQQQQQQQQAVQSQPPQQMQFPHSAFGGQMNQHQQTQMQNPFANRTSLPGEHQGGQQQSGLPRGGMMGRGTFTRGGGRGGSPIQASNIPNIHTGIPVPGMGQQQQGSMGSPGRLNAGARQFVPIKRSREEGEIDEGSMMGKKIRGGHHG